jgi:hypothetical protein
VGAGLRDHFVWRGAAPTAYIDAISGGPPPARDLAALARGHDAVGLLARLARDLASDGGHDGSSSVLLEGVRGAASALREARQYRGVADLSDGFDDDALRALAAQQSLSLLDELLAQKEIA